MINILSLRYFHQTKYVWDSLNKRTGSILGLYCLCKQLLNHDRIARFWGVIWFITIYHWIFFSNRVLYPNRNQKCLAVTFMARSSQGVPLWLCLFIVIWYYLSYIWGIFTILLKRTFHKVQGHGKLVYYTRHCKTLIFYVIFKTMVFWKMWFEFKM